MGNPLKSTQVSKWLKDNAESKHAAVYAVVGKDETVNFVGVGRNVALSVAAHLANEGEDMVHFLKVNFRCFGEDRGQHCYILLVFFRWW